MKKIAEMGALELKNYRESSNGPLHEALVEIERLRDLFTDIVDDLGSSSQSPLVYGEVTMDDCVKMLERIDDAAHKHFLG
jgi:hypothetical protein